MRSTLFALAAVLCTSAASRAFAAASLTPLGDLPGGGFQSQTFGVSGDGSTNVGSSTSESGAEAFRHTTAGGMVGLGALPGGNVMEQGVNPAAAGWEVLVSANGVSRDGNTIVGYGIRNGNTEAFVAVVPEPTALGLLGLAAPALLRRRGRCRPT